ncbi:hypothetical protein SUDANB145_01125 [Streptomyces sp. enrichment culture]|uniref:hypothetical protein n=1 Tax=Streptomyces sp. enrichment culture TaxID=1795815 RepID=UPI003F565875
MCSVPCRAPPGPAVGTLADPAQPPLRHPWPNAATARPPTPLLIGVRLLARHPGRAVLSAVRARRALAVTRTVGAAPGQVVTALCAARLPPAALGVAVGTPAGRVVPARAHPRGPAGRALRAGPA